MQRILFHRQPSDGAEPRGLRRPGPVDSLASRSCHRLIRDGARLVETVDDILEELGPLVKEVHTAPDKPPSAIPPSCPSPIKSARL
jgi:predicted Rossmann fold nucleotide-binding protein DprA/Smf involved in DNA uptake